MQSVPSLYQSGSPFFVPQVLVLDVVRIVQLITLGFIAQNNDAYAPSAQNTRDNWTNAIGSPGTKVDDVCDRLREINRLGPVQRKSENLFGDGPRDR